MNFDSPGLIPIWQGRFQPFHNGHYYVAKKVLEIYGRLIIAIVVPDPQRYPEKYEKFLPSINPFSYYERFEMIYRSFEFDGIDPGKHIAICPMWGLATKFKRELPYFPAQPQRLFIMTQIRDDNFPKIQMIKDWNGKIEIFRDIPLDISGIDGMTIRDKMCNGEEWKNLVPHGTVSVIDEYKLEKKVRDSMSRGW